jgi:sialic acid synthase SpsE
MMRVGHFLPVGIYYVMVWVQKWLLVSLNSPWDAQDAVSLQEIRISLFKNTSDQVKFLKNPFKKC